MVLIDTSSQRTFVQAMIQLVLWLTHRDPLVWTRRQDFPLTISAKFNSAIMSDIWEHTLLQRSDRYN